MLAAGKSSRLGSPKQLLPFHKKSLIRVVTENLLETKVDKVIVVLGHQADTISNELQGLPVRVIINPEYELGHSSSMIAGVKAANLNSSLMFVLGDQPLIKSETINHLVDLHMESRKIVVPSYQGKNGHPVIFPKKFRSKLLSLQGDIGAKHIIAANRNETLFNDVKDQGIILDIDTWNDYQLLSRRFNLCLTD
ncbi:nucleotidyltransferase family protein [Anaerobacillus arseniciselenatis]|uniref:nucleotidyltransferase family protein n=1 Tax=Anaerobacillus arseniciselenatis TaxID=85682 RepID=UPI001FE13988|nr:nucleotidyltransferase family protein [Anaerobacillus arseniciselenatis]